MTAQGVYAVVICITVLMALQILFIFIRGRTLKSQQNKGSENSGSQKQGSNIIHALIKASGVFLTVLCTVLSQFFFCMLPAQFSCDQDYEKAASCDSQLRMVSIYFSLGGLLFLVFLIFYSDFFVTKWFPD